MITTAAYIYFNLCPFDYEVDRMFKVIKVMGYKLSRR
jgi:hypothetical protein